MTTLTASTHGPEHANPATKARFRSSCEGHGLLVSGQMHNSRAGRSTGNTMEAVETSSQFVSFEGGR